ncbi:hypothetical protein FIBSPDRAFT_326787 [Athelia psychrophila]|uniref:Uncharacterized protein n=1 Tax=Athelia psychrophila TaxID=1759441 RepID=A0A166QA51_9AGAM|nr:hypothetical protein FIBSPDRAFT_326787 [Fibularhizoctonia sp. CBS 109695]
MIHDGDVRCSTTNLTKITCQRPRSPVDMIRSNGRPCMGFPDSRARMQVYTDGFNFSIPG